MAELLFEIFCEEIPARMQTRAGNDLSKALTKGLEDAGLKVTDAQVLTGPRRLAFVADVPLRSPDISEERKGPRVGAPEQALAGFMRGAGLSDMSEAETRSDKKGEYYVAVIEKSGSDTAEILSALIPSVMQNFPWPKSMKSGATSFRWVRPLQSMICLLDGKVIELEVGGITAGNVTEGHRRHGKGPFTVTGLADYRSQLEGAGHVMLSAKDRAEKITKAAKAACDAKGMEWVEDDGLLAEVAGLAEWPVVILGDMDPAFLELPGEVIRLSMRTHQKYFAVKDPKTGDLAPHFIVVANQDAPDGGKAIAEGNSRVLSARLADAQFFQSEDAKKKLIEYYDKLDTVVFHKKLGSVRDKADRVADLAKEIAPKVGADAGKAEQAAKLAKCDLVTNMVVEFTSLQGQIGALMYRREGAALRDAADAAPQDEGWEEIATAIEDHYKPQGPSDAVPTEPVAIAVALADKLDTLAGFWAIDEKPTGSKDPFALRRAALGVVRIILENGLRFETLTQLVVANILIQLSIFEVENDNYKSERRNQTEQKAAGDTFAKMMRDKLAKLVASKNEMEILQKKYGSKPSEEITSFYIEHYPNCFNLLSFILDRLKVYLRDQGVRHDIIDAVYAKGGDDLVDIVNRITALQDFVGTADGENLLAGYKRAANILKAEAKRGDLPDMSDGTLSDTVSQGEARELQVALTTAKSNIDAALSKEAYSQAMTALSQLRAPIDAFFENVMVVAEDEDERANNLRLLGLIRDTAHSIADFDVIQG